MGDMAYVMHSVSSYIHADQFCRFGHWSEMLDEGDKDQLWQILKGALKYVFTFFGYVSVHQ